MEHFLNHTNLSLLVIPCLIAACSAVWAVAELPGEADRYEWNGVVVLWFLLLLLVLVGVLAWLVTLSNP